MEGHISPTCRRCGVCCRYPCGISWVLFNPHGPEDFDAPVHSCPALEFDGEEATCGMVAHPRQYADLSDEMAEAFALLMHEHLAIGEGCGAQGPTGERLIRKMLSRRQAVTP